MNADDKQRTLLALSEVHAGLGLCRKCSTMCGTPVHAHPIATKILALGQAPGLHEAALGRPFAFTAGKTLFKWLETATDLDEAAIRERIYFSAVARCFPGKAKKGAGDREPSPLEIENCREHVRGEVLALKPTLLIAIGRIAIAEALGPALFRKGTPLHEVVGRIFPIEFHGVSMHVIPLPHPSGVSRWPQTEPGKTKLAEGLALIRERARPLL